MRPSDRRKFWVVIFGLRETLCSACGSSSGVLPLMLLSSHMASDRLARARILCVRGMREIEKLKVDLALLLGW